MGVRLMVADINTGRRIEWTMENIQGLSDEEVRRDTPGDGFPTYYSPERVPDPSTTGFARSLLERKARGGSIEFQAAKMVQHLVYIGVHPVACWVRIIPGEGLSHALGERNSRMEAGDYSLDFAVVKDHTTGFVAE